MLTAHGSQGWKYQVKQGDTLWDLATEILRTLTGRDPKGIHVQKILVEIARASKLNTTDLQNRIKLGQQIVLPQSVCAKLHQALGHRSDTDSGSANLPIVDSDKQTTPGNRISPDTISGIKTKPDADHDPNSESNTKSNTTSNTGTKFDTRETLKSNTSDSAAFNTGTAKQAESDRLNEPIVHDAQDVEHAECDHSNEKLLVPEIVRAISKNEGSLKAVNWDDSGAGISVGLLQWNQERGALPTLIREWNRHDPSAFRHIFHGIAPNGTRYWENLLNERWLRNYNIAGDPALKSAMIRALANPGFQQVQHRLAKDAVSDYVVLAHKFNAERTSASRLSPILRIRSAQSGPKKLYTRQLASSTRNPTWFRI